MLTSDFATDNHEAECDTKVTHKQLIMQFSLRKEMMSYCLDYKSHMADETSKQVVYVTKSVFEHKPFYKAACVIIWISWHVTRK